MKRLMQILLVVLISGCRDTSNNSPELSALEGIMVPLERYSRYDRFTHIVKCLDLYRDEKNFYEIIVMQKMFYSWFLNVSDDFDKFVEDHSTNMLAVKLAIDRFGRWVYCRSGCSHRHVHSAEELFTYIYMRDLVDLGYIDQQGMQEILKLSDVILVEIMNYVYN